MTKQTVRLCLTAVVSFGWGTLAVADESAGLELFENKIRPLLVAHCYECHSREAGLAEGELQLDTRQGIRQGGSRGLAVVPGDPEASLLLQVVRHDDPNLQMPPKQPRLSAVMIADLARWISSGAADPRTGQAVPADSWGSGTAEAHWAYQSPVDHEAPAVQLSPWPANDIDRFVLAGLEAAELDPAEPAAGQVLVRRLFFDLIGLPPEPAEVQRWTQLSQQPGTTDGAADLSAAYVQLVDRLLASPQFGERWGRHWLDVARFGESSGKEANISFPYAFRYRDYVIDSFNADLPFDEFLTQQIAGDLLPYESPEQRARLLIATGFLAIGSRNLDEMNPDQFAADLIDEQIDTLTRAVLANSVACARCHDHKFDPFSMQDYYRLAGIFRSTRTYFGTAVSPANRVGGDPLVLPRQAGQPVFHQSIPVKRVEQLQAELTALQQEQAAGQAAVWQAIAAGRDPGDVFTLKDALRIFWRSGAIEGQLEKVDGRGRALPLAMGVQEASEIRDAELLQRGEVGRPGDVVPRGFPQAISVPGDHEIPRDTSGRRQLARWLTHPQNPLTARVIVNRVWQQLFGAGLVTTVDNFGTTGQAPSHPELLDDLAVQFVREGWSLKQLIRQLVLSRTYQQSSTWREAAFQQDPDNRWLWRMPKRRLQAEAIRDAMLAVSGELDCERPQGSLVATVIGDKPISLIGLDQRLPADLDGSLTRSVYLPVIRDRLPDVLELFDFAEPSLVTGTRATTNVPVQALYLLNSSFVQARAAALAGRLESAAATDPGRVDLAFQLCFARSPTAAERQRSLEFLSATEPEPSLLVQFCQSLLCAAEFRNLD